jgi:SEC-C motif-containing protein
LNPSDKQQKVGRNDPCPCGSGKKYKRCHGAPTASLGADASEFPLGSRLDRKLLEMEAQRLQREQQQGLGKPIISSFFQGHRFVLVGNKVHYSRNWKTFHDFLGDNVRSVFGLEWGTAELKKAEYAQHPFLHWYRLVCKHQREHSREPGSVYSAPMTGAAAAYFGLAYNLYLLAHNARLHALLMKRLKNPSMFFGACYETYVAAEFIKAGFLLDLEDEADSSQSHCEFVATYAPTGRRFSVEAKARLAGKANVKVGNQLHAALSKRASHPRIVFIDINVPGSATEGQKVPWLRDVLGELRRKEVTMTIDGQPAPPAYVFLTNYPYQYCMETMISENIVVSEGFKIPEYRLDCTFRSIREARLARERHKEMFHLMKSMSTHREIPSTFDGEIPEFAYDNTTPRLRIGDRYLVPIEDGTKHPGTLVEATVLESEGTAYGVYKLADGRQIIVTCPLTDRETAAFKRHPDTFFGVPRPQGKRIDDPLDFFDWAFEIYRHTPKEQLLTFMHDHHDIDDLRGKDQQELATIYCERMAESAFAQRDTGDRKDVNSGDLDR